MSLAEAHKIRNSMSKNQRDMVFGLADCFIESNVPVEILKLGLALSYIEEEDLRKAAKLRGVGAKKASLMVRRFRNALNNGDMDYEFKDICYCAKYEALAMLD